jgi:pimeloyl-ACP methyl ester carboxylesterase
MGVVEVSAGPIHYEERGEGPPLVLLGGLAMDWRLWEGVAAELAPSHRCVMPTMPLGSHPEPMRPDADLSLRGMARIVAELIEALDLDDVTLCFNDWSCGQVMVADGLLDRVAALVFSSCETEGNYPPGLAGRAAVLSARMPGGLSMMRQTLLRRRLRQLPFIYGQMSKRGVPDGLMREWLEPLRRPEIRRDVGRYIGDVAQGKRDMAAATSSLGGFERPVLVAWDAEGPMMPNEHGRKLASDFPDARLVEIADSYTLIPIDQPRALAAAIRDFTSGAGVAGGQGRAEAPRT